MNSATLRPCKIHPARKNAGIGGRHASRYEILEISAKKGGEHNGHTTNGNTREAPEDTGN